MNEWIKPILNSKVEDFWLPTSTSWELALGV